MFRGIFSLEKKKKNISTKIHSSSWEIGALTLSHVVIIHARARRTRVLRRVFVAFFPDSTSEREMRRREKWALGRVVMQAVKK